MEWVRSLKIYKMILNLPGRNSEQWEKGAGSLIKGDGLIFKYLIRKAAEQQINVKRPMKLRINGAIFFWMETSWNSRARKEEWWKYSEIMAWGESLKLSGSGGENSPSGVAQIDGTVNQGEMHYGHHKTPLRPNGEWAEGLYKGGFA